MVKLPRLRFPVLHFPTAIEIDGNKSGHFSLRYRGPFAGIFVGFLVVLVWLLMR